VLLAVAPQAGRQVDAGGPEAISLANLDVLAIDEQCEQVCVEGPRVAQLEVLDEVSGDTVECFRGDGRLAATSWTSRARATSP
jgi:hypothetical protein